MRSALAIAALIALVPAASPQDAPPAAPRWLVGDLHVHVAPPDAAGHSALTVAAVVAKAREIGLDFVVLTPHDADRTFAPSDATGPVALTGQDLERKLAREALAAPVPDGASARPLLIVPGWEFTRERPGHLTCAFFRMADVAPLDGDRKARRIVDDGGLVAVAHPFFRPVKVAPVFRKLMEGMGVTWSADRRWHPFFGEGADPLAWNAIEVWHERSALVQRAHEKVASEYPDTQMVRAALTAWDHAVRTQRRRIVGVAGSDCHGRPPYALLPMKAVSVLADGADEESLRRGLVAGRVAFGLDAGAAVRDFAATSDVAGERATMGDGLRATKEVRLTWSGRAVLFEDGERVGEFDGGAVRKVEPPGCFRSWRIERPDLESFSNAIFANPPR